MYRGGAGAMTGESLHFSRLHAKQSEKIMRRQIWYLRPRDLRFLGLIAVTGLTIAMYLDSGLRLASLAGSGWRTLDLDALKQRIETGELRQREAGWYHPATEEEMRSVEGAP